MVLEKGTGTPKIFLKGIMSGEGKATSESNSSWASRNREHANAAGDGMLWGKGANSRPQRKRLGSSAIWGCTRQHYLCKTRLLGLFKDAVLHQPFPCGLGSTETEKHDKNSVYSLLTLSCSCTEPLK